MQCCQINDLLLCHIAVWMLLHDRTWGASVGPHQSHQPSYQYQRQYQSNESHDEKIKRVYSIQYTVCRIQYLNLSVNVQKTMQHTALYYTAHTYPMQWRHWMSHRIKLYDWHDAVTCRSVLLCLGCLGSTTARRKYRHSAHHFLSGSLPTEPGP